MALNLAIFKRHLAACVADLPVTCAFSDGVEFTATPGENAEERTIEIDGELVSVDRIIVFDAEHIADGVTADSRITVDGDSYRVLRLTRHQDGHGAEISLKRVYQ